MYVHRYAKNNHFQIDFAIFTNRQTNRWTDGPTDGRTNPLIEMRQPHLKKQNKCDHSQERRFSKVANKAKKYGILHVKVTQEHQSSHRIGSKPTQTGLTAYAQVQKADRQTEDSQTSVKGDKQGCKRSISRSSHLFLPAERKHYGQANARTDRPTDRQFNRQTFLSTVVVTQDLQIKIKTDKEILG